MTHAELIDLAQRRPGTRARLRRGTTRVGYLTTQTTTRYLGDWPREDETHLRIRDDRRRRSQYTRIYPEDVDAGRVELKVGARYHDARDVSACSTCEPVHVMVDNAPPML